MATRGGARLIGMERHLGSLEQGKLADLVLIRSDPPHLRNLIPPDHSDPQLSHGAPASGHPDPYSAIVYSAKSSDVDTVLVSGRIIVRNGALTRAP
jgi:5-methylthioadenosine/S-adenosylhomocysteine deaminase